MSADRGKDTHRSANYRRIAFGRSPARRSSHSSISLTSQDVQLGAPAHVRCLEKGRKTTTVFAARIKILLGAVFRGLVPLLGADEAFD